MPKATSQEPDEVPSLESEMGENEKPTPQAPKMDSVVKSRASRPRPVLEGINAPVGGFKAPESMSQPLAEANPSLTEAENKLISEPVSMKQPEPLLMPKFAADAAAKPRHRVKTPIVIAVILLVLIAGAYEYYVWKVGKPASQKTITHNVYTPPVATNTLDSTTTPSSTPVTDVTGSSTPATSTPSGVALKLKVNSTPTGFLNVRATPATTANIVTKIYPGDTYTYVDTKDGWYEIMLPNNLLGWVSGQYVSKVK